MKENKEFSRDKRYKIKFRIYYAWDYEVSGEHAPALIERFYKKNKPGANKTVYHMIEELRPKEQKKMELYNGTTD